MFKKSLRPRPGITDKSVDSFPFFSPMTFIDATFLPFLLLIVLATHLVRSKGAAIWILILGSLFFYGCRHREFLLLLIFVSFFDFALSRILIRTERLKNRKWILALSLVSNLGLLCFFKYADFALGNLNVVRQWFGFSAWPLIAVTLPVGISFFIFETISYSVDIYKKEARPARSLRDYLLFLSFFPHLVAGPIVRGKDFLEQLDDDFRKRWDPSGFFHIGFGFAKKLLLADPLGSLVVDPSFLAPASFDRFHLLIAAYSYSFQIFLDFSAYSDIAIGVAKLVGIDLKPNFNAPYLASSFTDFWRRWHISLSTWFRDYVYLPLGGGRRDFFRVSLTILTVFLLSGLWHGAQWKFVGWGLIHGILLIAERAWDRRRSPYSRSWTPPSPLIPVLRGARVMVVFHLVTLAWVFFRADSFSAAGDFLHRLVFFHGGSFDLSPGIAVLLFLCLASHCLLEPRRYQLARSFVSHPVFVQASSLLALGLILYGVALQNLGHRAFIYFQF